MTDLSAISRNWRDVGDTPLAVWESEFRRVNSPMLPNVREMYEATRPHSALCLAQMWMECKYETDRMLLSPSDRNPLNLRPHSSIEVPHGEKRGYATFGSFVDCVKEWKRRITSTSYKAAGGIYTPTRTLDQFINLYAPPGDKHEGTGVDNAAIGYARKVSTMLGRFASAEGSSQPMSLNFDTSLVSLPAHRFHLATRKVNGTGMDYLGDRVHRGIVFHRALSNTQSLEIAVDWLLRPSTRGLTDGFIDHRSGEMVIINPMKVMFPKAVSAGWRDMAGWANGPYSAPAAWPDGPAFRNRYGSRLGASIINQDLESMEVTGNYDSPISEACKRTLTQWAAARAQYHKIPWNAFPINPKDGLTMIYGHREFCGDGWKVCPGSVVWAFITGEMIGRVKAILKAAQTGAIVPVPEPAKPDTPVAPSKYATPSIPAFITNEDAKPALEDGNGVTLFWTDRQYITVRETRRLQYADKDAKDIGPLIPAGQDINIAFVFTSHDGREYGLTPFGTRLVLDDVKIVADSPVEGIKGALKSAL